MYHLKIRELRYKITLIQNYRKKVRNSTSARLQEKHSTHTTPPHKPQKRQTEQGLKLKSLEVEELRSYLCESNL